MEKIRSYHYPLWGKEKEEKEKRRGSSSSSSSGDETGSTSSDDYLEWNPYGPPYGYPHPFGQDWWGFGRDSDAEEELGSEASTSERPSDYDEENLTDVPTIDAEVQQLCYN